MRERRRIPKRRGPLTLLVEVAVVVVLGFVLYQIVSYWRSRGELPNVMDSGDLDALIGDSGETLRRASDISRETAAGIRKSLEEAGARWKEMSAEEKKAYVKRRLKTYERRDGEYAAEVKKSPEIVKREPPPSVSDPEMEKGLAEYQKGRIALRQARAARENGDSRTANARYKTAEAHFRLALSSLKKAKDRSAAEALEPEVSMLLYASTKERTL